MATFTTWTALKIQMQNDLAALNINVGEYQIDVGGNRRVVKYRSADEWWTFFREVEKRAATETGTTRLRTYAKQGGRG